MTMLEERKEGDMARCEMLLLEWLIVHDASVENLALKGGKISLFEHLNRSSLQN